MPHVERQSPRPSRVIGQALGGIIGFPLSGKRTLAVRLARTRPLSAIGVEAIRLALDEPRSEATRDASRLVSSGEMIPLDASVAELNRRFVSQGKDPPEVSHPGALARFRKTLDPLLQQLDDAKVLVVLNADDAPDRLVAVARSRLSYILGGTIQ